jgi:hypothetical protein
MLFPPARGLLLPQRKKAKKDTYPSVECLVPQVQLQSHRWGPRGPSEPTWSRERRSVLRVSDLE